MLKDDYCDLNIPVGPNCRQVCTKAFELGYKILAINTVVVARNCIGATTPKIGKKRKFEKRDSGTLAAAAVTVSDKGDNGVPKPAEYTWIKELLDKNPGRRILRRITIIFGDVAELHKVTTHQNCSLYDIIAVVPIYHDSIQSCLTAKHITFDMITFDLEGPYWIKRLTLTRQRGSMAADRDIFFEITYSSGLHGDSPCENMIFTAHRILEDACTKRIKNVILSSGAGKPEELRTPKAMLQYGFLLGFDETTTTQSIREHPQRIVSNVDSRKYGKTWVKFIPAEGSKLEPISS